MGIRRAPYWREWLEIEIMGRLVRIKTYKDENGRKILCCPTCGGKPGIKREKSGRYSVYCECEDCEMRVVGYRRRKNAIRIWNKTGRGVPCGLEI